jgi:hypothetical protein
MNEPITARRPGGLTALAVLNIVLGLGGLMGGFGMTALNQDSDEMHRQADELDRLAEHPPDGQNPELHRALTHRMAEQMRSSSPDSFRLMSALGYTGGVLLLVSAVGLLGRRRLLGMHVALGAGISLLGCAVVALTTQSIMFWGFPMFGFAYAIVLVTLVLASYRKILVA